MVLMVNGALSGNTYFWGSAAIALHCYHQFDLVVFWSATAGSQTKN